MNAPSRVEAELSMSDFLALAQPGVQKLSPYVPGKPVDELARELGIDPAAIVKLASNENPLGASPKALEAIRAELAELTRYPDGNGFELKRKLAERSAVDAAQVTLGNGSNDILDLVARAYLAPGLNAVFSEHAFAVYPIATQAVGAEGRAVKARAWGHDLEAMLAAIDGQTRVVFVANPNNPTGTWFGADALERFLAQVPAEVLVVLDEAYIEYAEGDELPDGLDYLARHPNLLVSRTFSKAYGLASLRVGYALSSKAVADVLEDGFHALGLSWIPSKGNFIAVDLARDAGPVYQALLREGVIVRPVAGYGMPTFLRVSIGLPEENDRFLQALGKVLAHD